MLGSLGNVRTTRNRRRMQPANSHSSRRLNWLEIVDALDESRNYKSPGVRVTKFFVEAIDAELHQWLRCNHNDCVQSTNDNEITRMVYKASTITKHEIPGVLVKNSWYIHRAPHTAVENQRARQTDKGTEEAREREKERDENRKTERDRARFPMCVCTENRAWLDKYSTYTPKNKRKTLTKTIQKQKRSRLLVGPTEYTLTNLFHKYCIASEQSALHWMFDTNKEPSKTNNNSQHNL